MVESTIPRGTKSELDLSTQVQAEKTPRLNEEWFHFAMETSHTGVWDMDLTDHTTFRSPEYDRIFGYMEPLPRWTYEMFLEHVAPEDRTTVDAKFKQAMATRSDWGFECRIHRADGELRWIWAAGRHLPETAGGRSRMAGIIQEITERKRVEEELRRVGAYTRRLIEASLDPLVTIAPNGTISDVNRATMQVTGRSREELIGADFSDYFTEPAQARAGYKQVFAQGAVRDYPLEIRHRDHHVTPVLYNASVFRDESGEVIGVFAAARDVTELKRAEDELCAARHSAEAASRAKSEFMANMSHEIRTPMNAIIGLAYLALRTNLDPKQQDYVTKINSSARQLLRIIDDILDFSKIEAGKLRMARAKFLLRESLDRVAFLISVRADQKGLELRFILEHDVPDELMGDSTRLEQILINLLDNSVKFTEKGEITLSVALVEADRSAQRAMLRFSVTDTGIGLSSEHSGQLFQPFTQNDSSSTRRYGGTGLGLSICKRLVEMMGGAITATGEPGKGCTFSFTAEFGLGTRKTEEPGADPSGADNLVSWEVPVKFEKATIRYLWGIRVLLAEDHVINQQVAREIMEQAGIIVVIAANGCEAVELALRDGAPFDAILMDLQMPMMDGYEATRRIRTRWSAAELPIIAMTAHAMADEREKCLRAGMNDHLPKPVEPDELYRRLLTWVKHKETVEVTFGDTPVAPERRDDSFPTELPGLDPVRGLAHVCGNTVIYCRLLDEFCREHGGRATAIRNALTVGDLEQAHNLAHSLKGVAGALAAEGLAAAARDLDTALSERHPDLAWRELPRLEAELALVLHSVALMHRQEQAAPARVPGVPVDSVPLAPLMAELVRHLKSQNLKALKTIRRILEAPIPHHYDAALTELTERIEALDFDTALPCLRELAESMGIVIEEEV